MTKPLGVYIHIPFCQKQCHYCDFLTFVHKDHMMDDYVKYLIREIELYQDKHYTIDTIYLGGGTPSYLPAEDIQAIIEAFYEYFNVLDDCEITIEMNPESVSDEKVQAYLEMGINRFSMGVQSFNDEVLNIMGRLHNRDTVIQNIHILRDLGVDNLSIDMMFANPKQTMDVLLDDLETAASLDIHHISYYSLMIKEKTYFYHWLKSGKIKVYDDELEREMYHRIQKTLEDYGFIQYEISNFARKQSVSRHNQKYWNLENYLGLGLGASSNMDLMRFSNSRRFDQYYQKIDRGEFPIVFAERMNLEDREKEYIMLNLRLIKGFEIADINRRFNINFLEKYAEVLEKHQRYGTIHITEDRVAFTPFGLDVGNQFYLDII